MCDFISWIEKNGKLYYLTDAEIFSPAGKKKLEGCRDNDYTGHGAIRKYFNLGPVYFSGSCDHEVRGFWETSRLPTELANKVKDFNTHWGKTFETYLLANDYGYIMRYAPIKWAKRAFNVLIKSKRFDRITIIKQLDSVLIQRQPSKFVQEVLNCFLKLRPSKYNLHYVLRRGPEKIKDTVWKTLKHRGVTKYDVCELGYSIKTRKYYLRAKRILRETK